MTPTSANQCQPVPTRLWHGSSLHWSRRSGPSSGSAAVRLRRSAEPSPVHATIGWYMSATRDNAALLLLQRLVKPRRAAELLEEHGEPISSLLGRESPLWGR